MSEAGLSYATTAAMKPSTAKFANSFRSGMPGWLLWLGLVLVLVACHTKFLFLNAHAEAGDFAANSLQIRSAKHFQELYGNYSRWGFHHPGPAFFYTYAAGEWLFWDLLKVVPCPFNAHILTGIMLQSAFFIWALCIVRQRVGHPLVIGLLLILGAAHFAAVTSHQPDSVFTDIWPPHVLVFPFLCFVVACASFGSGSAKDLIPAILAACFLVHGHVAQPLFVVPCFLVAVAMFLKGSRHAEGSIKRTVSLCWRYVLGSALIVAVALLPLILDAAKGKESNLSVIVQHFSGHSSDRKTLVASLTYLLTFFCYVRDPEKYCDKIDSDSFSFLEARWPFATAWVVVSILLVALSGRAWKKNPFVRSLYLFLGLALILTTAWGIFQNGSMMNFNAHFNYGLIFLIPVLLGTVACEWITPNIRTPVTAGLTLAGLLLFIPVTRGLNLRSDLPYLSSFGPSLSPDFEKAVSADGKRAKFLLFPQPQWPNATALALAVQRAGSDYRVSPDWSFMFGRSRLAGFFDAAASADTPIWRLGPRDPWTAPEDGFALADGAFVVTSGPQINPAGGEIRFTAPDPNWMAYSLNGWSPAPDKAGQLLDTVGVLEFRPANTEKDVEVSIELSSNNPATSRESRNLTITFNGLELARVPLGLEEKLTVRIPQQLWNQKQVARLLFRPTPPPSTDATSNEPIRFERIVFRPALPSP